MKKSVTLFIAMLIVLIGTGITAAADMEHGGHMGKMIRQATVDGYGFAYHLIDMQAKMKEMAGMHDMTAMAATHHLMVYISAPDGKKIEDATVGYLITAPDKTRQKAMTMGMSGGYGADIHLMKGNDYTITAKALTKDGTKLIDTFTFKLAE